MDIDYYKLHTGLKARSRYAQMEAYDLLFQGAFYKTCVLIGNKMEAEDIVHDSFIQAFDKIEGLRDPKKIKPWFNSLVRNQALQFIRQQKIHLNIDDQHLESDSKLEVECDWERFSLNDILNSISKLAEGYRYVVSLYLLDDLSHEEISKELGISVSASRSQLSRAKRRLIELLTTHERT